MEPTARQLLSDRLQRIIDAFDGPASEATARVVLSRVVAALTDTPSSPAAVRLLSQLADDERVSGLDADVVLLRSLADVLEETVREGKH